MGWRWGENVPCGVSGGVWGNVPCGGYKGCIVGAVDEGIIGDIPYGWRVGGGIIGNVPCKCGDYRDGTM